MANIEITNIDNRTSRMHVKTFADDTFTAASAVYADGTVLARNTATGKLVPYASAGLNGADTPVTVLTYEIDATGAAGDKPVRVPVDAEFNRDLLIEHGVGLVKDQANPWKVYDSLQDYNISSVSVSEENILDNQ